MTIGASMEYSTSTRQKINTKSSTKAELVSTNDLMPQVLWTHYFLEAQGYKLNENGVFQDNQSAILLEKNGKRSCSKRTRHSNIHFSLSPTDITDRIQSCELLIKYCPTGDMVGDFFTKPLQGLKFQQFRKLILNTK